MKTLTAVVIILMLAVYPLAAQDTATPTATATATPTATPTATATFTPTPTFTPDFGVRWQLGEQWVEYQYDADAADWAEITMLVAILFSLWAVVLIALFILMRR